jgi:hypothetical protein
VCKVEVQSCYTHCRTAVALSAEKIPGPCLLKAETGIRSEVAHSWLSAGAGHHSCKNDCLLLVSRTSQVPE